MTGPTLFDAAAEELTAHEGRYRRSDPVTSKQAAMLVKAGNQRGRILIVLAHTPNGMNGYEAAKACGISRVHGATTRLGELEALGFAYRTGQTRPTDTACQALIFFATNAGRDAAAQLEEV